MYIVISDQRKGLCAQEQDKVLLEITAILS